jgi:hypothetical protein
MSGVRKPTTHQVSKAGQHFVAAELHRRGANASVSDERRTTVLATNTERTCSVTILGKTMTTQCVAGINHAGAKAHGADGGKGPFWVLVDLEQSPGPPQFYIVPEWWIENDIYTVHQQLLVEHGGHRARTDESTHHAIEHSRIEQWRDRWDLLGVFADD